MNIFSEELVLVEENAFGDLEFEPFAARGPKLASARGDDRRQRRVGELDRRHVDRDADVVGPASPPRARGPEHPLADRFDQPAFLGDRDEFGRADRAASRVIPADQRLVADDPRALGRHHRLIGDEELVRDQRAAQIVLELLAALGAFEQFLAEESMDAAPVALCRVHRDVGVAGQRFRIAAVLGRDRDADRTADRDRRAFEEIGLRHRVDHGVGELGQFVAIAHPGQHDLEFVAAEPPDQPRFADHALQPLRDLLEQRVADLVTERVVDRLEPIEVEQEQRRRAGARLRRQRLVERRAHALAVGEAGQAVEQGEPRDLRIRAALFGQVAARADKALESAEIVEQRTPRNRPPAVAFVVGRGAHRIIGERSARGKVEVERPLGIARSGIDAERVDQPRAQRLDVEPLELAGDLGRQIGEMALAVGLPEPAVTMFLDLTDKLFGKPAGIGARAAAVGDLLVVARQPHRRDDQRDTGEHDNRRCQRDPRFQHDDRAQRGGIG